MLYRKLGKTNCEVSVLGFGCMRLPMVNSNSAVDLFDPNKPIDEEEAGKMISYAIEQGINYFDTAYPYHGGQSETFLGKELKAIRDKVMIATKLPTWMIQDKDEFDTILNEQLQKLKTDYIDFYLVHGLNRSSWYRMKEMGVLSFLDKIIADGRTRYVGFSFHDDEKIFKEIVDSYDWSLCQIQYNYFDENYQAGREGLEYAAAKELGVVVMEPLRGGKLTDKIPREVEEIWDKAETKRTPVEWALRWVWNHAEVATALSGMSEMDQLVENIRIAEDARSDSMHERELALIQEVTGQYRQMLKVDCTACAYCMPCPNSVDIPINFSFYNDTFMFKDADLNVMLYNHFLAPEQRASNCAECGECEEHCPQQINIIDELKNVDQRLSQEEPPSENKVSP
jgi:predicted aldo/keto reductase-like oxidoreductase